MLARFSFLRQRDTTENSPHQIVIDAEREPHEENEMMNSEDVDALIIDNGTSMIKAGFGGDDTPRALFPTVVGDSWKIGNAELKQKYIGAEAFSNRRRRILNLKYPIQKGLITNWTCMESIWHLLPNKSYISDTASPTTRDPTFVTNDATTDPTASPTPAPTPAPTSSPTTRPTSAPIDNSNHSALSPVRDPTPSPDDISQSAPTRSPIAIMDEYEQPVSTILYESVQRGIASYSSNDISMPLVFTATTFTCIGLLISILCLVVFCPKLQDDSSRGTLVETIKEMSCMDRSFFILKVFDAISDFMFASDLLLSYDNNSTITIFGWVCFISGIFGAILMYVKFLLSQKILYKVAEIRTERDDICLKKSAIDDEVKDKTQEIRDRNSLMLFLDLLTVSLEDCPQVTISLLISLFTGFENQYALMSLALSLLCIFWTPVAIFVNCCGLVDDPIHNLKQKVHVQDRSQEMERMKRDENLPEGWSKCQTEDGRDYYQNDRTKTTQWEKP